MLKIAWHTGWHCKCLMSCVSLVVKGFTFGRQWRRWVGLINCLTSERKRHINFFHIKLSVPPFVPGIVPGTNRVCPRDKPGEIGLPLCKIRRKPGFVPGFQRICTRDKPGEMPGANPGSSQDQPDKTFYVYVPFLVWTHGQKFGFTVPHSFRRISTEKTFKFAKKTRFTNSLGVQLVDLPACSWETALFCYAQRIFWGYHWRQNCYLLTLFVLACS